MKWTKIEEATTIPDEEVVALNDRDDILVGFLQKDFTYKVVWECQSDSELLSDVIAYIETKDLISLYHQ